MRIAAVGVVAVVVGSVGVNAYYEENGKVGEKMFEANGQVWPCNRVILADGTIGCGSRTNDGVGEGGSLVPVETEADIDMLIEWSKQENPTLSKLVPVLKDELLTGANMDKLLKVDSSGRTSIATVLVLAPENATSSTKNSPRALSTWNPTGDGLSALTIPFSVSRLKTAEQSRDVLSKALENKDRGYGDAAWQHSARFEFYMGKADTDSRYCLDKKKCDPLGGYSVWGTVGPLRETGKELVLATATMDASAFFHDLAFGRNTAASGIVALLLALKALGEIADPSVLAGLSRQVGFGFFQADSWDRIGSRRFVRDISVGCTALLSETRNHTCAAPAVYSLAWTLLELEKVSHIVAIDQVAVASGDNYYVHPLPGNPGTNPTTQDLANIFDSEHAKLSSDSAGVSVVGLERSTVDDQVPPTAMTSFLESGEWQGAGLVLTGYDNGFEPTFQSRLDRSGSGSASKEEERVTVERLAQAATLIARSLFVTAGGDPAQAEASISVNRTFTADLWACFTEDFACEIVSTTLGVSSTAIKDEMKKSPKTAPVGPSDGGPLSLFTSPYTPFAVENGSTKLLEKFLRNFAALYAVSGGAQSLLANETTLVSCSADFECLQQATADNPPATLSCQVGISSLACVKNKCVCANAYFHDALSPALRYVGGKTAKYMVNETAVGDDKLYTEPRWFVPTLVFYVESFTNTVVIASAVTGIALTFISALALVRAKRALKDTKLKLN